VIKSGADERRHTYRYIVARGWMIDTWRLNAGAGYGVYRLLSLRDLGATN